MTKLLIDEAVVRQALEALDSPELADEFEQKMRLRQIADVLRAALEQAKPEQEQERNPHWKCGDGKCDCPTPDVCFQSKPAQQDPVGQLQEAAYGRGQVLWFRKPEDQALLYTAPPRRDSSLERPEWVSLTDDEIKHLAIDAYSPQQEPLIVFARAIEAKLKEKNQ